jgi:hypothetical protein
MYRKAKNEKDVRYILEHLRADDLAETKSVYGENYIEENLKEIMETNFDVLMGVTENGERPVAMGGAWHFEKDEEGVGVVWALCTDEIVNHKISFLREIKKEFKKYDQQYWFLYNFIHKNNSFAKNWLKWLGFNFNRPKPLGLNVPEDFEFFFRIRPKKGLEID